MWKENCVPKAPASNLGKKHLTEFMKGQILQAHRLGSSGRSIAKELMVSKSSVCDFLRRYRATGIITRKEGSGRSKKLSERQRRRIIREVRMNRFISAFDIRETLGIRSCYDRTIRAAIKDSGGFKSYWAAKTPFISEANRVRRVQWAQQHLNYLLFYGSIEKNGSGGSATSDTILSALWALWSMTKK